MAEIEPREFVLKDGRKGIIRHAKKSDARSLLNLFDAIVGGDEYNVTTLADVEKLGMTIDKEEKWIEEHNKDGTAALVADLDGKVVGFVGLENGIRKRISHVASLHISVLKEFRRNGIATSLLKAAEDWAKSDSLIEKIGLGVFANNIGAIKLYKKLGFIEEGRRIKEIKIESNNYIDSILMYKLVK